MLYLDHSARVTRTKSHYKTKSGDTAKEKKTGKIARKNLTQDLVSWQHMIYQ